MRVALFCHSLASCWNHGNAHFLRGVAEELIERGHAVEVFEPADAWSRRQLEAAHGEAPIAEFRAAYPRLESRRYELPAFDVERAVAAADLVLVHEWTDPALVARLGRARRTAGWRLLFHDTHHRSVSDPAAMAALDLSGYDGVLAFGQAVAERYREERWARHVWVWHEAADVRRFRPLERPRTGDLVWVGNWGDDERTREFLLGPVADLGLAARVYGVRYPPEALAALEAARIAYGGWLPNHRVPEVFAAHRCTVHVPRRAYASALPGIPTIRMFEALACGIPLVSAPWDDVEGLFRPGIDYLVVRDRAGMARALRDTLGDPAAAAARAAAGLETILARHTCAHRVDELLAIAAGLGVDARPEARAAGASRSAGAGA
jgi:spore maturation protein CgeB